MGKVDKIVLLEVVFLWEKYKLDMCPETRNDFLRHFNNNFNTIKTHLLAEVNSTNENKN